jgi:hypothetical protein
MMNPLKGVAGAGMDGGLDQLPEEIGGLFALEFEIMVS